MSSKKDELDTLLEEGRPGPKLKEVTEAVHLEYLKKYLEHRIKFQNTSQKCIGYRTFTDKLNEACPNVKALGRDTVMRWIKERMDEGGGSNGR